MNPQMKNLIAGLTVAGMLTACAAVPPSQLVEARDAYDQSNNGATAKLAPTELYDAKKVLDKANSEFSANGDTTVVRDYSYIAKRKIELADSRARTESDRQHIADDTAKGLSVRDNQLKNAQGALASTRRELKDERSANKASAAGMQATNDMQGQQLDTANDKLDAETRARMTAESKLAGAMKDLAAVAAVKEEERGVVITLSGSVLFASGKYDLLDTAKTKLDQVATALMDQSDDKKMVVEGHTDSRGSNSVNQPLSMNRAGAVRDYLVTRGVDANKISAIGMGSSHPILDNGSAENRANNRRVEIVIQPVKVSAR